MIDCGPECMEALKEVERLLDGELEGELRIKVEQHLSGCSPCMDRTEFRRHLKMMIAAKCTGDSPPPQLLIRVRAIIEERDVSAP
jgi:mycothiol system anti-sigma-R factor